MIERYNGGHALTCTADRPPPPKNRSRYPWLRFFLFWDFGFAMGR